MARGPLRGAGLGSGGNSVTTPAGVICAILLPKNSVNQRLPSRPAVMAKGPLSLMRSEANSVITPAEVIRPMTPETSANQILPSGPTRSEEHTSELQSLAYLVCRLLLEKK